MKKEDISLALKEAGTLLELSEENYFKVKAYYDASRIILGVQNLDEIIKENKLSKIKGIGPSISEFIKSIYFNGTHPLLEDLKKRFPSEFLEILKLPGMGIKKLLILQKELNITSIKDLTYAIYENRLTKLKGFGKKTQDKLKESLSYYETIKGKLLLNEAIKIESEILSKYPNLYPAGALRRRLPIIDTFEFVLKDIKLKKYCEILKVKEIKIEEDFILFKYKNFDVKIYDGGANFFKTLFEKTGSEKHLAQIKNFKEISNDINSEEEIYKKINLDFIPPEMREGIGEVELAKKNLISKIIDFKDIKGALHNHTIESDGASQIEDYIKVAKNEEYSFVGIADHSKSAKYAGGLEEERLLKQIKEINSLNKDKDFIVFSGVECDMLTNGELDYGDELLEKLDYIVVSIHSHFNLNKEEQTKRILNAISNKSAKILGHPTGRILLGRKGYEIDIDAILERLGKQKKWIELNSNPLRLDLDWQYIKKAQDFQVPISISPDAHNADDLKDIFYGVLMAKKGLLFKENCINTWENEKLKEEFNFYEKRRKNI